MECLKLQHKTLVIKLLLFSVSVLMLFSPGAKGTSVENSGNPNLTELYDSARACFNTGKYAEAVLCLDKIIGFKKKSGNDNPPQYYKVYNWYGFIYQNMGVFDKAVHYYEKTLEYPLSDKNRAWVLMNIGNVFTSKGDFNPAIIYYNKVLSILPGLEDEQAMLADTYYNIGQAYDNSLQYRLALKYFLLSTRIRKDAGLPDDGDTYLNCATDYFNLGKTDSAGLSYKKAIQTFEKANGKNHYTTALVYIHYAVFLAGKGKHADALQLYNKTLKILSNVENRKYNSISYCYRKMGELQYQLKNYEKALSHFQESLIAKVYDFNDTSVYSNPSSKAFSDIDILDVFTYKALIFEELAHKENEEANLLAASKTQELKIEVIEQLRAEYLSEKAKLKLSENEDGAYRALIRISGKLYHKTGLEKYAEAAFKYSEKSKYGVLREFYNEETLLKSALVPDSLIEKQKKAREKLNETRWLIENENNQPAPDKAKIDRLKEQLFRETRGLEALSRKLEKDYPKYLQSKYNNKVINIKELQSVLRDDQTAFEYTISDSTLYTFFVSKDTFRVREAQLDRNFYKNLNYYKIFLNSFFSSGSYDSFRISAYYLYQTFLQPFEKEITGKSLLIIPDEYFALISFEALVDEPYKEVEFANYVYEPYIIRKYPIGYAFSASLYEESLERRYSSRNKILAIAPDYKISGDSTLALPFLSRYLRRLTRIGGRLYNKTKATETNLKKEVANYNIIHIYAHGQEDVKNPSNSCIFLSSENDTENDGCLYAHEVASLPLNAKLVVLASCYSGSGKISEGEGVLSIGRSFLSAGTSSLIMSLWYTYLEVSTQQIGTFHKQLLLGERKDVALQRAKLKYLENANELTAHPKEWASLVIIGNQEPLYHFFILKAIGIFVLSVISLILAVKSLKKLLGKNRVPQQ
jgi:CHAT domain-containing protein/Tfp pilus assembly protein PilF